MFHLVPILIKSLPGEYGGKKMKRSDIVELIRYHVDRDDPSFNSKASTIAHEFEDQGAVELASYIRALISETRTFVPMTSTKESEFLSEASIGPASLPLPSPIANDLTGIVNAVSHNMGVNRFLFVGAPGTGKTESAKQIARIIRRKLYKVSVPALIDSRLGETAKNIITLFDEIAHIGSGGVVLFDEIDALALDRINVNDVREMGRATSTLLSQLDSLPANSLVIATTNLFPQLDKALVRRFDKIVDFDRYNKNDLVEVGESIAMELIETADFVKSDRRLLKKILQTAQSLPMPGELKNVIRSAIAFSDSSKPCDYLVRLYLALNGSKEPDLPKLRHRGFTVREMEILTGISKSKISRLLKETDNE